MTNASTTDPSSGTPAEDEQVSDYDLVGGGRAVSAVVGDFYERVLADEHLSPYFEGRDLVALKRHQVQLVSHLLGGPVEYTGREMRAAHDGLGITSHAFARVAEHLVQSLRDAEVPEPVVMRLVSVVAASERDVVSAPS
ncbi:group I truncated hemoglobin [Thalassiella azotivora]